MQSGSDGVLRRMRRRWGSQRFIDRCRLVQERLDRPAITTDIIVGFPGETDAEFARNDRHGPRRRLLEDSHLPVQPAPRHAGGRDAEPSAEACAARALARTGGRRSGTARRVLPQLARPTACACWWKRSEQTDGEHGLAHPAATRRSSCRPARPTKADSSTSSPTKFAANASSAQCVASSLRDRNFVSLIRPVVRLSTTGIIGRLISQVNLAIKSEDRKVAIRVAINGFGRIGRLTFRNLVRPQERVRGRRDQRPHRQQNAGHAAEVRQHAPPLPGHGRPRQREPDRRRQEDPRPGRERTRPSCRGRT